MKRLSQTLVALTFLAAKMLAADVEDLRCEYLKDPLGIDSVQPRLSWIITSNHRGEMQSAYHILVASSPKLLKSDRGDLWDSGKVASPDSTQIVYSGKPLSSRQACYWKARVWDQSGSSSHWSKPALWEMGLLQSSDWSAQWITSESLAAMTGRELVIQKAVYSSTGGAMHADVTATLAKHIEGNRLVLLADNRALGADPAPNQKKTLEVDYAVGGQTRRKEINENELLSLPDDADQVPCFRKTFDLSRRIKSATLYVTALGLYEMHINGAKVGDIILAPDWTDYRKRIRYQTYDVTGMLKIGPNALGAMLGDGWYSGHIGNGGFQYFGKVPALMAQLEITYADGQTERIATDSSWKVHTSPIVSSDFMQGETYDARAEIAGWDKAGLNESAWLPAAIREEPKMEFDGIASPPVREIEELKPKSLKESAPGHWVYDMGQNMVGVVRLKISAPAGTKVTIHHAEMLNPDGTIYVTNLRGAPSVDHYICSGKGTEVWHPHFTFHGFRYVELTGLDSPPSMDAVTGIVIASDVPRAGEFSCSDPRLNQLQSNIQWGQLGNYVSIPTDCPQRDERLGWMGDAQVFVRTATYNADVAGFFTKWLVDVDDGQTPEGSFSDVSPNTMGANSVPAWGDAGVICPWTIYDAYGDKRILEKNLPSMIKWVEYLRAHSTGLIRDKDRGNDYGDWLNNGAETPKSVIGTAFFAYSTHLLAKSCEALGRTEDAAKYNALFEDIKAAFVKKYVGEDGRIRGDTQTDYAMALKFGLMPDDLKAKAAEYLAHDIQSRSNHLSTGFIGVGYLLPMLTDSGYLDTAGKLLTQDTFPSWLFSVKHGATTIWERWDGWTPDKGFQDPGMNSFNHYSLGSCGEYLFGYIGGIRPASPGFSSILIKPTILTNSLTWAQAQYDSIHGRIATSWKLTGNKLALNVTIPANTTATICVPTKDAANVTESGKSIKRAEGVRFVRQENDNAIYEVGSGTYKFDSEI